MADYYQQTVIQQTIPDADVMPIERLLLTRIFESEQDGDGRYFFAEQAPSDMICATRAELDAALAATPHIACNAYQRVTERLEAAEPDAADIFIDLSGTSWECFFQDIVKRSKTLCYITVVSAFTCSKMRPDGFGGMAILITHDAIVGKSTNELLEEFLVEAGLDDANV